MTLLNLILDIKHLSQNDPRNISKINRNLEIFNNLELAQDPEIIKEQVSFKELCFLLWNLKTLSLNSTVSINAQNLAMIARSINCFKKTNTLIQFTWDEHYMA